MKLISVLKSEFRKSRKKRWNRLFDLPHYRRTELVLASLREKGKELTPEQSSQCNEYAKEVLGSEAFAGWLKVYTAFQGEFKEGWIPDNYIGRVVGPAVNGELEGIAQYKTLTRRIINSDSIPDLAYSVNGSWIDTDGRSLRLAQVYELCFDQFSEIYLKGDFTYQGLGIIKLTKTEFENFKFSELGNFVIQAPIYQHTFFDKLSPNAVATIRVTTVKPFGKLAEARLCGLRIGRGSEKFIQSKKALQVPVYTQTGKLFYCAISPKWETFERHPSTDTRLGGLVIPKFGEMKRFCENLHNGIPHLELIGWDIALDKNEEIKIMEWNTGHPGIVCSEPTTGPHFKGLGWEDLWKDQI